jgi:hypothetical protein
MNSFMNALWGSEGSMITGKVDGVPFLGYISDVRVKYGNDLGVTISYDQESVKDVGYGSDIIDGSEIYNGGNYKFSDLHVYFD